MYKIGITGSIGSGKTTIAKKFTLFNIPVFNADKEIKKILDGKVIRTQIKQRWPTVFKDGYFNKLKLRSIIFSNKNDKKDLEMILYPELELVKKAFEQTNYKKKIVVYDVPLIYETKSEKKYDLILLVHCDETTQRKRVLQRDKITNALFKKITASQLSFEEKKRFNPKIINTNRSNLFIFFRIILLLIKIIFELRKKNGKEKIINT